MLTTIYPCWDFSSCKGYLVGEFNGRLNNKAKVYVSNLMTKIHKSNKPSSEKITIKSPNQLFINEPSSMPNTPTSLKSVNYVEAYVSDDVIKKKANEDLYNKYLQEMPYPTPVYYIPFKVNLPAGQEVTVSGINDSLVELSIKLE